MGSRLFGTLVGMGISLGMTSGCLGRSNDTGPTTSPGSGEGGSGGNAVGPSGAAQATTTLTTSTASGGGNSATLGTASSGGATAGGDTVTSSGTRGGGGSGDLATATGGSVDVGGAGGAGASGGGTDSGAAGQGGEGFDPFCDTTWPTTKGNPAIPECVDPDQECQDEYPQRCLLPLGEFVCDGHFERSHAPLCVNGNWECEAGLVPASECRCFGELPEGHICSEDGHVLPAGEQP